MKKRMASYIEENQRAYEYYLHVPGGKNGHFWASMVTLLGISIVVFLTRKQFLWQHFLRETGKRDLGRQEVREWVNAQVASHKWDLASWILIGATMVAVFWIWFVYKKVKSYELYKMQGRLILPPVIIYMITMAAIICFSEVSIYSLLLAAELAAEMLPIFCTFKLFLPLDMREGYGKMLSVVDLVSQIIIKRL